MNLKSLLAAGAESDTNSNITSSLVASVYTAPPNPKTSELIIIPAPPNAFAKLDAIGIVILKEVAVDPTVGDISIEPDTVTILPVLAYLHV
jgi:hypothetical protein